MLARNGGRRGGGRREGEGRRNEGGVGGKGEGEGTSIGEIAIVVFFKGTRLLAREILVFDFF